MKKAATSYSLRITHACASVGYIFVLLLWAWTLLMFSYPLITDDSSPILPTHSSDTQVFEPIELSLPEPLSVALGTTVTIAIIILSIYLIVTLPRNIAKSGSKIVQKSAQTTIPIITGHRKISEKKRRVLSARIVAGLKMLACVLPIVAILAIPIQAPLDTFVAQIVALFCGIIAAASFFTQYVIARTCKIPLKLLW